LLARTAAGRRFIYGVLMAHPGRVSSDHALGDIRAFIYARPTLYRLLAAATPFTDPIPLDVPVTIAWARRDLVLPPWQAHVANEQLPQAEHIMMRGVGHVPMHDDPDFVAQVLLRGSAPVADVAPLAAAPSVRGRSRRKAATATA
jgi:pimeloyl-ACP methyl ester carboxylesterase